MTTREFTYDKLLKLDDFGNVSEVTCEPELEITIGTVATQHLYEIVQLEVNVSLKMGKTQTKSEKRPKLEVTVTHGKSENKNTSC